MQSRDPGNGPDVSVNKAHMLHVALVGEFIWQTANAMGVPTSARFGQLPPDPSHGIVPADGSLVLALRSGEAHLRTPLGGWRLGIEPDQASIDKLVDVLRKPLALDPAAKGGLFIVRQDGVTSQHARAADATVFAPPQAGTGLGEGPSSYDPRSLLALQMDKRLREVMPDFRFVQFSVRRHLLGSVVSAPAPQQVPAA